MAGVEAHRPASAGAGFSGDERVTRLPGVGPAVEESLDRLGIRTIADLWFHLPLRYEDRTSITPLDKLVPGMPAQVEGVVAAVDRGFRFRPQLKVSITDDSGAILLLRFFHFRASQAEQFSPGVRLRCFGEPRVGTGGFEIVHPSYQRVLEGAPLDAALTPVYPATEGLSQKRLLTLTRAALDRMPDERLFELLPDDIRKRFKLASLSAALRYVHRPPPKADVAALLAGTHPAQQRLAFEELLAHHVSMRRLRAAVRAQKAPVIAPKRSRRAAILKSLPFKLTKAQQRVLGEVDDDVKSGAPMLRLVQGDVGSGKTVVAALAALAATDAGWQTAVMAPTEVLAEQHYRSFARWLEPLGVRVVFLAGKVKGKARGETLAAVANEADVIVGTHALMQEGVSFRKLGLAVVDEQHRFGVHQRLALRDKAGGVTPHQLVMTATPIPRTLAMTSYADLDVSVIDELPPGRQPITTVVMSEGKRPDIVESVRRACRAGRQAYWVCTLIEESEKLEAQAAEALARDLEAALPDVRVGLVHGRMKPAEKQAVMDAFSRNEVELLVATTVIEVGVDVPNATVVIIENAERLGLSQLHQLRGRVGRGRHASTCVLMYSAMSEQARERLSVLRETNDGFRIAEKDLELRGPGEMLGTRQTGEAGFRVADLVRDAGLLERVAEAGRMLLETKPDAIDPLVRRWIGSAAQYASV